MLAAMIYLAYALGYFFLETGLVDLILNRSFNKRQTFFEVIHIELPYGKLTAGQQLFGGTTLRARMPEVNKYYLTCKLVF